MGFQRIILHPSAFILYCAGLHVFALTGAKTVKKEMGTA
jgi:hypothetical protein